MNRRAFISSALVATLAPQLKSEQRKSAPEIYTKRLSDEYDVDVFVAGGGPAGVCAAVAAARTGASVFVAEASGAFGGAATAAYVPAFATFSDGRRQVVGGIGGEIRGRISKSIPINAYWTPIDLEELKRVYDDLVVKAKVKFSFFTSLCDAITSSGHVERAVLASKRGLFAVKAKMFIDCTGDGDLAAFAGAHFEKGDETGTVMPCTLCSQWIDIDTAAENPHAQTLLPKAIEDGVFSVPDLHLPGFFFGPDKNASLGRGNIGHAFNVDPTDERSLTAGMIDARRRLPEYERFYKKYLKGYERMSLASTAPYMGVRESRRILCDYMLGVKDFLARADFDDGVGRYCYPVDLHPSKPGDREAFAAFMKEYVKDLNYKAGESYGIPYRSLVVKGFDNMLVAGRCMGADRKMQASIRVMPGCFITGQAAGTAAAMALKVGGTRSVDIDMLRKKLISAGVVV